MDFRDELEEFLSRRLQEGEYAQLLERVGNYADMEGIPPEDVEVRVRDLVLMLVEAMGIYREALFLIAGEIDRIDNRF